jgi:hypothetical protein
MPWIDAAATPATPKIDFAALDGLFAARAEQDDVVGITACAQGLIHAAHECGCSKDDQHQQRAAADDQPSRGDVERPRLRTA